MDKVYVLAFWRNGEYLSFSINDADVAIGTLKEGRATYDAVYLYVTDESGRMDRIDQQF